MERNYIYLTVQSLEVKANSRFKRGTPFSGRLFGLLVVLGLTALWGSISVYIGPSCREETKKREKELNKRKLSFLSYTFMNIYQHCYHHACWVSEMNMFKPKKKEMINERKLSKTIPAHSFKHSRLLSTINAPALKVTLRHSPTQPPFFRKDFAPQRSTQEV